VTLQSTSRSHWGVGKRYQKWGAGGGNALAAAKSRRFIKLPTDEALIKVIAVSLPQPDSALARSTTNERH